ncbi:hypothetical protein Bca4012_064473 [Brassica carinata]
MRLHHPTSCATLEFPCSKDGTSEPPGAETSEKTRKGKSTMVKQSENRDEEEKSLRR